MNVSDICTATCIEAGIQAGRMRDLLCSCNLRRCDSRTSIIGEFLIWKWEHSVGLIYGVGVSLGYHQSPRWKNACYGDGSFRVDPDGIPLV